MAKINIFPVQSSLQEKQQQQNPEPPQLPLLVFLPHD